MRHNYFIIIAILSAFSLIFSSCALLESSKKIVLRGSHGETAEMTSPSTSTSPVAKPTYKSAEQAAEKPSSTAQHNTKPENRQKKEIPSVKSLFKPKNTKKSEPKPQAGNAVKDTHKKKTTTKISKEDLAQAKVKESVNEVVAPTQPAQSTPAPTTPAVEPKKVIKLDNAPKPTSSHPKHKVTEKQTPEIDINGEWTIYSVRKDVLEGEERPYITFDTINHRFYGTNGCNYLNGQLNLSGNEISFSEVIATHKMCHDAPYEYLINLAISDVTSFVSRHEGTITYLDLKGKSGHTVMVLRRHNMDFLNGAWHIYSLNGSAMPENDNDRANIVIDIPELKIHGTSGCNIFNGALFIDPDKSESMQFLNITTTQIACPDQSRELELLLALESVETARHISKSEIGLYNAVGAELMRLRKILITK